MTDRVLSTAWTEDMARDYLAGGSSGRPGPGDDVASAWRLALTIVRQDHPRVRRILDVASGPGRFLNFALDLFPEADGIWFDFSHAMRERAEANLAAYGDRVHFEIGDFLEVGRVAETGSLDLVLSASATHHLNHEDLGRFYIAAGALLVDGGWIVNHDILLALGDWDRRMRAARDELRSQAGMSTREGHPHPNPFPTYEAHAEALVRAGFEAPQEVWRSSVSSLLLAKRAG